MTNELKKSIISAIVSAIVTGLFSVLIFHLGNFSTQKSIVESLSKYFDSVNKEMSYEQALEIIYKENKNIKEKNESLNKMLDEMQDKIGKLSSSDEINEIIKNATEFWDNSNYNQSLILLNNSKEKSSDIESLYKQYSDEYVDYIITQANSLILEGKYEEAINCITEVLPIVSDDSLLKQKIEDIQNSKPQYLMKLSSPYEKKGYTEKINGEYMIMGGEKYYDGFQLGESFTNTYAIFNLGGKFTKINGFIGHVDNSGESDKTVTIFGDGILIDTIEIDYQELPKEFEIDVSGVNQLKFERSDGSTQTGFGTLFIQ